MTWFRIQEKGKPVQSIELIFDQAQRMFVS